MYSLKDLHLFIIILPRPLNELHVVLSGEIDLGSELEQTIKSNFSKVFYAPRDRRFTYTYRIEDDPQAHKFITLYAASLCE